MIKTAPIKGKGLVRVTFELPSTVWAEWVNLVGEFNELDTLSTPMTRERADTNWKVVVELETGRRYNFRYLVDGKEWLNDRHLTGDPSGFGLKTGVREYDGNKQLHRLLYEA